MEKALEFLTKLKQSRDFDGNLEYSLDEAIAELEEAQLTRREWYQKGYAGAMKPKTCKGCKTLPFVLTELSKRNGGKCGTCKRYVKDNYQAEPKEQ